MVGGLVIVGVTIASVVLIYLILKWRTKYLKRVENFQMDIFAVYV